MSDNDTTIITEENDETAPEPSRFKKALNKVAPYAPHIATAVVAAVGGALIFRSLAELESEETEIVETDVLIAEPVEE